VEVQVFDLFLVFFRFYYDFLHFIFIFKIYNFTEYPLTYRTKILHAESYRMTTWFGNVRNESVKVAKGPSQAKA